MNSINDLHIFFMETTCCSTRNSAIKSFESIKPCYQYKCMSSSFKSTPRQDAICVVYTVQVTLYAST